MDDWGQRDWNQIYYPSVGETDPTTNVVGLNGKLVETPFSKIDRVGGNV